MAEIIPDEGIVELMALGGGLTAIAFTQIAVGSGNTAFTSASGKLNTEITTVGLARATATVTQEEGTFSKDTLQFVKAFNVTGDATVKEIGITNHGTKDHASEIWLYLEVIDTERVLVSGDTYTVTIKIIAARA